MNEESESIRVSPSLSENQYLTVREMVLYWAKVVERCARNAGVLQWSYVITEIKRDANEVQKSHGWTIQWLQAKSVH